jgi:hypothetical protein
MPGSAFSWSRALVLAWACLASASRPAHAANADSAATRAILHGRFYAPPPGFSGPAALPPDFRARVHSLRLDRRGAFEGTAALTGIERKIYAVGSSLHVLTRAATVRRFLPFTEGDMVDRQALSDAERALRALPFLSDAYLAVAVSDSGCAVAVTTFDQWTTSPVVGATARNLKGADLLPWRWSRLGQSEWWVSAGLFESNVAGTGTRAGLAWRSNPERKAAEIELSNGRVGPLRWQTEAVAAWLSDGDSARMFLAKPLESRSDKHAYGLMLSTRSLSERYWFDQNRLEDLPSASARAHAGREAAARIFEGVSTHAAEAYYTRSYGYGVKFDAGPFLRYRERYQSGGLGADDSLLAPFAADAAIEPRRDVLPGAAAALYSYRLATTRNFRNLKWSETVETGWRLSGEAGKDASWLGARVDDWRLGGKASAAGFWADTWWLSASVACSSFVSAGSGHGRGDGRFEAAAEAAWRANERTATWLSASWANLFASPASAQLTLGDVDGLNGFASHAFAGQARLLLTAEQRWFPRFEWLTQVPAFSVFATAGNTYPAWRDADPGNLHGSAGVGLRLGRSKTTQKTVQHINVNFPLGEPLLPGVFVSILVRRTL